MSEPDDSEFEPLHSRGLKQGNMKRWPMVLLGAVLGVVAAAAIGVFRGARAGLFVGHQEPNCRATLGRHCWRGCRGSAASHSALAWHGGAILSRLCLPQASRCSES